MLLGAQGADPVDDPPEGQLQSLELRMDLFDGCLSEARVEQVGSGGS